MKIYARQVPPEHQESPLMIDDCFWEEIICDGNRDYKSRTTHEYKRLKGSISEAAAEVEAIVKKNGYSPYKNITEIIHDMFFRENRKRYTTKEIHTWKELLLYYQTCKREEENAVICQALKLMTGKSYSHRSIRGCCQSDWQRIYYPDGEYSAKSIECFETEYFNLGSEWIVHDDETEPETPNDITGYSQYCYSWNDDGIRKEIADSERCKPEEVVIYKFNGYIKTAVYEAV